MGAEGCGDEALELVPTRLALEVNHFFKFTFAIGEGSMLGVESLGFEPTTCPIYFSFMPAMR